MKLSSSKRRGQRSEIRGQSKQLRNSRAIKSHTARSACPLDKAREKTRHDHSVRYVALQFTLSNLLLSRRIEPAGRHDLRANREGVTYDAANNRPLVVGRRANPASRCVRDNRSVCP